MRTWLYNRIKAIVGFPPDIADRIISPGAADNPEPPFMIVQMGVEQPPFGMPASSRTQQIPFTVWVHDDPGTMLVIDDWCKMLKEGLPTADGIVVGNMSLYEVKWEMIGEDAYDDQFRTNTRPVRFSMMTRR